MLKKSHTVSWIFCTVMRFFEFEGLFHYSFGKTYIDVAVVDNGMCHQRNNHTFEVAHVIGNIFCNKIDDFVRNCQPIGKYFVFQYFYAILCRDVPGLLSTPIGSGLAIVLPFPAYLWEHNRMSLPTVCCFGGDD